MEVVKPRFEFRAFAQNFGSVEQKMRCICRKGTLTF